jgi:hypothetical protein
MRPSLTIDRDAVVREAEQAVIPWAKEHSPEFLAS